MTGYEPQTFGVRSDHSTNCSTTITHYCSKFEPFNSHLIGETQTTNQVFRNYLFEDQFSCAFCLLKNAIQCD